MGSRALQGARHGWLRTQRLPQRTPALLRGGPALRSGGCAQGARRRRHDRSSAGGAGNRALPDRSRGPDPDERMTATEAISVEVPDIGEIEDVPVIEIHVAPGDSVAVDDPLLTLESDKAPMDVPAPFAGKVRELHVSVGDRVSQGALLLTMESGGEPQAVAPSKAAAAASDGAPVE